MAFDAKAELRKKGKEGKGLGKKEDGIKDIIKVKTKNSRSGVGHDIAEEFTYRWWHHVFNQAANNIQVTNEENGVKVDVAGSCKAGSRKRHLPDQSSKEFLYKHFVKSATLTQEKDGVKEIAVERSCTADDIDAHDNSLPAAVDEDQLNKCSGLTGHRAARHGHGLNGKLARLARQEAQQMTQLQHSSTTTTKTPSTLKTPSITAVLSADQDTSNGRRKKSKRTKTQRS